MIKQLNIHNWKSFGEAQLFIDPLTILIGTNASGKSNILDALTFLRGLAGGRQITSIVNGDSLEGNGIRGGMEWMIKRGERRCKLELVLVFPPEPSTDYHFVIELEMIDDKRIEIVSESLTRIKIRANSVQKHKKLYYTSDENVENASIATYFSTGTQGRGKRFDARRSISILSQSKSLSLTKEVQEGVDLVLKSLNRIFVFDPIPSTIRNFSRLSDTLAADGSNIAGVLAALNPKHKEWTEGLLSDYLSQLPEKDIVRVWTEPVGKFGTDAMLYCEEEWKPSGKQFIVDARGMSDGSLRFLAVMTAILTAEPESLLVIEEIDNGLHPSRANLLVKFLKEIGFNRSIDIICTTHNPALLNAFGNEMVPFISTVYRDSETGDSRIKLLEEVDHLSRLMARGKVGSLLEKGLIEEAAK